MEKLDKLNVREGTTRNQRAGASGVSCDGSPKASNSFPLVSPTAIINKPRGLYNVDIAATFGVPLIIVGDLDVLTKDIEDGKHEELLSEMTNDMRKAVMDVLVAMCDSIQAKNTNADAIPCKVSHVDDSRIVDALVAENINVDESPIVQSVLMSPFHGRLWKRLVPDLIILYMIISLVSVLLFRLWNTMPEITEESLTIGVPLIEDTRFTLETVTIEYEWLPSRCDLCKIFGHVHDHCLKKVSIPNVPTPTLEMTKDGFQTMGKTKKKGKSKSTNGG
nr:zinc knuckle CX2CX4HX4C [Tanacetum cinerariifolium]